MKLIEFFGPSNSGKTFAITEMVKRLKKHGYSVATIKNTPHSLNYENDSKDSMKYLDAGSNLSVAMGKNETVFHLPRKIKPFELLDHVNYDFVLVEGEIGFPMPKILFLNETEGFERCDDLTIAIVGDVKNQEDLQVQMIKPRDYETLYTTLISKAMPPLPRNDYGHCGSDYTTMMIDIIKGKKTYEDCVKLSRKSVSIEFDGKSVPIVPFISSIIKDVNAGILKNLKGVKKQGHVKIEFDLKN